MRPPDYVWGCIGAGVLGWNVLCADGCTLSERMDDFIAAYPVLGRALIAVVAIHLANGVAPRYDVIHVGFVALRRIRR